MKWGPKHQSAHKAWTEMHEKDFDPVVCYSVVCKLLKLKDEAIERGVGRLFREGKIKPKEKRPKKSKPRRGGVPQDDFR